MRMKQVCEQTGLTERAVRLYVQEGLVTPQVRSGPHSQSYHFTEQDVALLQNIAALRQAGLGLPEIRQMLQQPQSIPDVLARHRDALSEEIAQKQKVRDALEQLTLPQQGELARTAAALRTAQTAQNGPGRRLQQGLELALTLALTVLSVPLLLLTMNRQPLVRYLLQNHPHLVAAAVPMVLLPVLAVLSGWMAVRYASCTRRARALPCSGVGTVLLAAPDTAVREILAQGAGSGWGGLAEVQSRVWLARIWQASWNALRPDHWYPLIQYTDADGAPRAGTLPYGGLRRTWQQNQKLPVGWDPQNPTLLLPLQAPWLRRKALVYLVLAGGTVWLWQAVLAAL